MADAARGNRLAVFLHSGEYDKLHQGCALAAAGCASGRPVDVFFFWYALEALLQGGLSRPHFTAREDLADRFEAGGYPTAQELLDSARASGNCTTYACTASSGLVGARPDRVGALVDHQVGLATVLEATRGVTDRFYL
jgi:peroxiredoxin family protein